MTKPLQIGAFLMMLLSALALSLSAEPAMASRPATKTVIEVHPGANAIKNALGSAKPGDILNIHAGTYDEYVNIKKSNITLQSAGDGTVIVDAQCKSSIAINMNAQGITVKGLTVRGGLEYTISLVGQTSGVIHKNKVVSTCTGAEYGVNVYNGGSIRVTGNEGLGFDDSAIYIGGISSTPNGPLLVKNNNTHHNQRGIIVEDSANVDIRILQNSIHNNVTTGVFVNNSDGILVKGNAVTNNGTDGIHLVPSSDNNIVLNNTFTGHTNDINNEGTGNCFSGNTYVTVSGDVSTGCP